MSVIKPFKVTRLSRTISVNSLPLLMHPANMPVRDVKDGISIEKEDRVTITAYTNQNAAGGHPA